MDSHESSLGVLEAGGFSPHSKKTLTTRGSSKVDAPAPQTEHSLEAIVDPVPSECSVVRDDLLDLLTTKASFFEAQIR